MFCRSQVEQYYYVAGLIKEMAKSRLVLWQCSHTKQSQQGELGVIALIAQTKNLFLSPTPNSVIVHQVASKNLHGNNFMR